jgi:hypothetical protein
MLKARQFLSIYEGFLESGLTVRDYCANQQIVHIRLLAEQVEGP